MKRFKCFLNLLSASLLFGPQLSFALDKKYEGTQVTHISVKEGKKYIVLQKLNKKFSASLEAKVVAKELDYSKGVKVPLAYELPWSVPVLDQGQYGTCVTFSATAVSDEVLGVGDSISQQCSLAFNVGLGNNYWNGASYSSEIIQPFKDYGIVSKLGCGEDYANPSASLSVEEYKAKVDPFLDAKNLNYVYYASLSVEQVKLELQQSHYVSIAFGLQDNSRPESVQGYNVVVGGKAYSGGLWACSQGKKSFFSKADNFCGNPAGGHEVIVYGYDDSQRLFKIRNSWSQGAGYEGNFFMSYEFFGAMNFDGTAVW